MSPRSLLLLPAACLAAGLAASSASAQNLIANVGRSGEVTVRRVDNGRTVATVRPGLFEATWQYRGVSAVRTPNPEPGIDGTISVNGGKGSVAVAGNVEAQGNRLNVRYTLTPNQPVQINSVHVSVNLPVGSWTGATWRHDDKTGTVSVAPSSSATVIGGTARQIVVEKDRARVTVASESPAPMMIQDNRVFSGSDLEIRVGPQNAGGSDWPAAKTETIAFSLDMGAPIAVEMDKPLVLKAGDDWIPLDLKLDVAAGSALDFASLADGPAGKYGRVVARPDGHFGFEKGPNRSQRFYGVNLCFTGNYLEKPEADRLAERLQRIGYNTVRIHHFESGLIDTKAPDSLTILPESQDKLDYLVAALKQRGIYVKTDLYISRPIKPGEAPGDNFKMALLVSPQAMENWKAFVAKLLNHQNPYTKLAWKDDPAVAWLSVINEGHALNYLGSLKPELYTLFQSAWETWLRARYGSEERLRTAWAEPGAALNAPLPRSADLNTARGRDVAAFVATLHERCFAEMSAFLRREIGTKALLTDLNGWSEIPANAAVRTRYDWIDNHFYWDHPHFLVNQWQLPTEGGHGGRSAIDSAGGGPANVAGTRLFGKPFSVSEYNYSAPNPYRAEGGLIMGAASALQDWDAVWRFAYSHSRDSILAPRPTGFFDMAADPAGMASERAAIMLFLRQDARPATGSVSLVRRREDLIDHPRPSVPVRMTDLTLVTRVGVRVEENGKPLPAAGGAEVRVDPAREGATETSADQLLTQLKKDAVVGRTNRTDFMAGRRESETGEIFVDSEKGLLVIDTPRTVGGAALPGETLTAGPLSAAVRDARAVIWASSLDGKPVRQSRRLLLVHVTDTQNTDMRYAASDRRVLESWGTLPHLVRRGSARVTLESARPGAMKAWRLDTSGNRVAPVPVRVEGNRLTLDVNTRAEDGKATLYYEIALP